MLSRRGYVIPAARARPCWSDTDWTDPALQPKMKKVKLPNS